MKQRRAFTNTAEIEADLVAALSKENSNASDIRRKVLDGLRSSLDRRGAVGAALERVTPAIDVPA
jgi:hypothetical protein